MKNLFLVLILIFLSSSILAQSPYDSNFDKDKELSKPNLPSNNDLPAPMDKEKSEKISKYFEQALESYEKILKNRPQAEIETTEKRIESNLELLKEQEGKLEYSKSQLRKIKLQYIRKYLILKNAYNKGSINKNTYEEELAKIDREYKFQLKTMVEDSDFYKDEKSKTVDRLKALQELNRVNKVMLTQQDAFKAPAPKPKKPLKSIEKLMLRLNKTGCFEVKNFWEAPDIK